MHIQEGARVCTATLSGGTDAPLPEQQDRIGLRIRCTIRFGQPRVRGHPVRAMASPACTNRTRPPNRTTSPRPGVVDGCSSTLWNLLRLHDLHSVEHDGPWLAAVRAKVAMVLPHVMAARWTSRHVPCVERKLGSCNGMGVHNPYRPTNSYTEYERTPARVFLPAIRAAQPDFPGFDYVVVDGRSRAKCVREATDTPGLLNPAHGILVLDNANSPFHSTNVSREWLYASFQNLDFDRGARTDVWMVCTRSDEHCTRARAELLQLRGCLMERSERVFPSALGSY